MSMRRSISLSPIRTESGANLRTANWTRLKFRAPHQQQQQHHQNYRNYNNYGNHQNYNRGYNNQRYQNRGRGYYRNQNFTTTRYIPRRRYNSNRRDDSRSRSRSYSRSVSRDRSRSRNKFSRSRSRSLSGSRRSLSNDRDNSSSSPEQKDVKRVKNVVKTEAASYYSTQPEKTEMDFPEKVATDLSRWGSPGGSNPTFQSSANKKMQEALAKSADPEEVQEKMKKTALESVARHEKSLHKFKLAQSKKVDSGSEQSDSDLETLVQKKKKKAKKKKTKLAKLSKKKQKTQKVKVVEASDSDSSNSDSSDEKSSDGSSSSSPPPKKSKTAKKKKSTSNKDGSGTMKGVQQMPGFFPFSQGAAAGQPMMMMLPSMTGDDSNMGFINQFGQPMNMIKIEMPGPDGKMMKFLQFPSMPQGAMPPVVMTQPVSAVQQKPPQAGPQSVQAPTTQNVAPPSNEESVSSNLRPVPIQEDPTDSTQTDLSSQEMKDLSEKQKRRKDVIRTRLWPRPATSNWSDNENEEKTNDQENLPDKSASVIPVLSPSNSQGKSDNNEMQGQKIPTLGGGEQFSGTPAMEPESKQEATEAIVVEEEEVHFDEPCNQEATGPAPAPAPPAPTMIPAPISQTGLVAYPQIVPGFKPVFSNPGAATGTNQDEQPDAAQSSHGKRQQQQWGSSAPQYYPPDEKSQSSEGECSSSSDEMEQYVKAKRSNDGKKFGKSKAAMYKEKLSDEEIKKGKKKKKNKKERKLSNVSDEPSSPVLKDKKRKKKKKNKGKDIVEDVSDIDVRQRKSGKMFGDQGNEAKKKKKDDLEREIPQELPLSHIRGLVLRKQNEGSRPIFYHIDFGKTKKSSKSLREAHDTYEDQFVSLFHEETNEPAESPLTMTRSALKKIKIKPQGTRSVTHMTKMTLCERISLQSDEKEKFSTDKNASQKVSVNFSSLSSFESKFDKQKPRSPSRSPSRSSKSMSKSPSKSRSSKSLSKSRSPRRYRSRSASRSSYSSRSRSRSLPKAYSVNDDRPHDDRRIYRRDGNRFHNNYQQHNHQQFRYNPQFRYQNRNRGYNNNYNNYNNRGNRGYYNNRGNYYNNNNRGYFNRNRGYYNNNNRDRQQWRPNYNNRDRRDSDRGDRSFERRSYTRSPERENRASSYSSVASDRHSADRSDYSKSDQREGKGDARMVIEGKQSSKSVKSPGQWTHDKFEEQDEEEMKLD